MSSSSSISGWGSEPTGLCGTKGSGCLEEGDDHGDNENKGAGGCLEALVVQGRVTGVTVTELLSQLVGTIKNSWAAVVPLCSAAFLAECALPFFQQGHSWWVADAVMSWHCPHSVLLAGTSASLHRTQICYTACWEEMGCSRCSLHSRLPEVPPAANQLWLQLKLQSNSPTGWVSLSRTKRAQDGFWSWREMLSSLIFSWLLWDRAI